MLTVQTSRALRSITLSTIAVCLLAACNPDRPTRLQATLLPDPAALPEFTLTGEDGQPFTLDSLRNRWTLMFFGFTHCPDICPATLQQLSLVRSQLAAENDGAMLPDILLISVDPARDTTDKLREYVGYFGEGIRAATGDEQELTTLTSSLGVYFAREGGADGDYNVSHSTAVLLINPDAQFQAVLGRPLKVDVAVQEIPLLMAAK